MYRSIDEWRKNGSPVSNKIVKTVEVKANESTSLTETDRYVSLFKSFNLTKENTILLIETVFNDPSQVPDDVSVIYVSEHKEQIIETIKKDDSFNVNAISFTDEQLENDSPSECIMQVEDNDSVRSLVEKINSKITKKGLRCVYDGKVFWVNDFSLIGERNQAYILEQLKKAGAKNIFETKRWTRKLKK